MQTRTFQAETLAEAARQVRQELGMNAMILGTRTLQKRQWLGLRRSEIVEITAAPPVARRPKPPAAPVQRQVPAAPIAYGKPGGSAFGVPAYLAAAQEAVRPKAVLETAAAQNAVVMGLQQEMCGLTSLVKDLVRQVRHQSCPEVPEDLFCHYSKLVEGAVAEEIAAEVIDSVKRGTRPEHLRQDEYVRQKLCEKLQALIPTTGPIKRTRTDGPHVIALIGPTGVGKTTTIAKLAAELGLRQGHRVGLVTIDTYRIAAIEQIRKYAELMPVPLEVVRAPEEMAAALLRLRDCDFVLIDTAGRSPKDKLKLGELREYLDKASPDEVHLVVSSTGSEAATELAARAFDDVRWDRIIFTKLDEAAQVGLVFNVLRKVNKKLSYVTTGQTVPDDLEVGHGRRLAEIVLGLERGGGDGDGGASGGAARVPMPPAPTSAPTSAPMSATVPAIAASTAVTVASSAGMALVAAVSSGWVLTAGVA